MLTDGGIETRVMFETEVELPEHVQVAALVGDAAGGPVLRRIYVALGSPTFRASLNLMRRAGLGGEGAVRRLNRDAAAMHREIRDNAGHPVHVAGVMGPSGDAYSPEEALPARQAREYHALQAEALAGWGVDFLYAPTFPAVEEALGASLAMGETGLPHVVNFVLRRDGRVLDGTPLHAAIERVDAASPAPLFYSISCVYPSVAAGALREEAASSDLVARRLNEVKANASPLTPEELVRLDHPEGDDPESFADGMWGIHEEFGLRVLGGYCGTDGRHMRALASRMAAF